MSQPLVSLKLDSTARTNLDIALDMIDAACAIFQGLPKEIRQSLQKLGERDNFCGNVADALEQNPKLMPPDFNLPEFREKLDLLAFLRPRQSRLQQIAARTEDAVTALGAEVLSEAREGYVMIRTFGKGSALEDVSKELKQKFGVRGRSKAVPKAAKPAGDSAAPGKEAVKE